MKDSNTLSQLPQGWTQARLEKFADIIQGQSPPSSTYNEEGKGLPFYQGKLEFGEIYPTPRKWCTVPRKIADRGDVLISVRAPVGPTNLCPEKSCIGRGLAAIRGLNGLQPLFILYLMRAFQQALSGQVTGTTFDAITGDKLRNLELPLPPFPEQHRIVAKIEELFTRLDAGVEALNKVKLQLKRYRQAVLKATFEGKLTTVWREAHRSEMEPASVLLEKIKAERIKGGKYKELPPLDISDLPELPEGWIYLTLEYLVSSDHNAIKRGPFGSAIKKSYFVPSGYKIYEQGNVIYNDFIRGDYFISEDKFNEMKGFAIRPGDILMSCSGTVGRIAIVPEGIQQGIINQALLKISLNNSIVATPYFVYLLRSQIDEVLLKNTRGSAMVNISSVKDLRQFPLAISPFAEQQRIVEEIERHFSVVEQIEKTIEQGLIQSERLRQSILKKAFEGKLVPRDPNDEPAEKLLERIKAEKARQEASDTVTRGGNKLNTSQGRLV